MQLALAWLGPVASAAVIAVDPVGPHPTIQSAVDASGPGDVVWIPVGVWTECVDALASVVLIGEDRAGTVIACATAGESSIGAFAPSRPRSRSGSPTSPSLRSGRWR